MKILIVAATEAEITPFLAHFTLENEAKSTYPLFDYLITGVGMVATTFSLTRQLCKSHYDLILNIGIAGAFDENLKNGTLVQVVNDTFSELGAENHDRFISINELGFGQSAYLSTVDYNEFTKVTGITVNTVHGNAKSIKDVKDRLNPAVESMEGAAIFYVAQQFNIPCFQIRAISNLVEPRNKENWEISLAIKNLNEWLIKYISNQLK